MRRERECVGAVGARWSIRRIGALATFVVAGCCAVAAAENVTSTWSGRLQGLWSSASNWSPSVVPQNGPRLFFDVIVDNDPQTLGTIVTVDLPVNVDTLEVTGGDGIAIASGMTLAVSGGQVLNDGSIFLEANGATADLRFDADTLVSGTGEFRMDSSLGNRIYGSNPDLRLTNGPLHVIFGRGNLGAGQLWLTNQGAIGAEFGDHLLIDLTDGPGNLNPGVITAFAGGVVTIVGTELDNTGGVVQAGANSLLELASSTVRGGTLRDSDLLESGEVRNVDFATLESVRLEGGGVRAMDGSTTILLDSIELEGRLLIDSTGLQTDLVIGTSPFVIDGPSAVELSDSIMNRLYGVTSETTLHIAPGGVVRGAGQFGAALMRLHNEGHVRADESGGMTIDLTDGPGNVNTGSLVASEGATLTIHGTDLDNGGGEIRAETDSYVELAFTSVRGGALEGEGGRAGGEVLVSGGGATLEDVTLEGRVRVTDGSFAKLRESLSVFGEFMVDSQANQTGLLVETPQFILEGPGVTRFSDSNANSFSCLDPSFVITIAPGHRVRGSCALGLGTGSIVNEGEIEVDGSLGVSIASSATGIFENKGSLILSEGDASIEGPFDNAGMVGIDLDRTLTRIGVYGQSAGATRVDGALHATEGATFSGGVLTGTGTVGGPLFVGGGVVAPGASAGLLQVSGDYTQGPAGALSIEVGGSVPGAEHDALVIDGGASLGGTLSIERIDGFVPLPHEVFTILTCIGARKGEFAIVESCDVVSVSYLEHAVSISFPDATGIVGDLNFDGHVNGADITVVLGDWGPCGPGCCPGDADGDGIVNGADITLVLGNWAP